MGAEKTTLPCPRCLAHGLVDGEPCDACAGSGRLTLAEWLAAIAEETDAPRGHERLDLEPTDPETLETLKGKVWRSYTDYGEGGVILGEYWADADPQGKGEENEADG